MRVARLSGACYIVASLCAALCALSARAIESSNVLVVYNSASADGAVIANYYAQVHPGVRTVPIHGLGVQEEISYSQYLGVVRPQVLAALNSETDVIVTTRGMPLRIDSPLAWDSYPALYTDPQGNSHNVFSTSVRRYSSLESELTRVDTISTWKQMSDQTWWDPLLPSHASNPYHLKTTPFDHQNPAYGGIRLTSRLDGFTSADVIASIDRAQNAFVSPSRYVAGTFVIDDDPTKTYDKMSTLVEEVLRPAGQTFVHDNSAGFVQSAPGPVLAYVGHGRNQASTPANYLADVANGLRIEPADGAVFLTWESYNAYTFRSDIDANGQGLLGAWLARGGTAGVGNVYEPGASSSNVTTENVLIANLLSGMTWVESAWSATRQLSFVNTVVGDPLMVWRELLPGDADRDGRVGSADLAIVAANWGQVGLPGGAMWTSGDFNGDGKIGSADMAAIADNWSRVSAWAPVGSGARIPQGDLAGDGELPGPAIPEPASVILALIAGAAGLASMQRYRRRILRINAAPGPAIDP